MSAVLDNIVPFALPKKPRVRQKEPLPDQRKVAVLPIRALADKDMTDGAFRALALLCSYCNRAGITWVSQTRLAKDMNVSQQAISKHFKQLRQLGYLETVKKGFKGERTDTLRVIFDLTVDAETAIAVTSSIEDTRPPEMKEQQQMEADPEGQRIIADLIKQAIKPVNPKPKEYTMPTTETATVRKMKEDIAKHKARQKRMAVTESGNPASEGSTFTTSEVVHAEPLHSQPNHNLEVVDNTKEHLIDMYLKGLDLGLLKVINNHMTNDEVEATLQKLQARCQSEGVPMPRDESLVDALLVLHADSL